MVPNSVLLAAALYGRVAWNAIPPGTPARRRLFAVAAVLTYASAGTLWSVWVGDYARHAFLVEEVERLLVALASVAVVRGLFARPCSLAHAVLAVSWALTLVELHLTVTFDTSATEAIGGMINSPLLHLSVGALSALVLDAHRERPLRALAFLLPNNLAVHHLFNAGHTSQGGDLLADCLGTGELLAYAACVALQLLLSGYLLRLAAGGRPPLARPRLARPLLDAPAAAVAAALLAFGAAAGGVGAFNPTACAPSRVFLLVKGLHVVWFAGLCFLLALRVVSVRGQEGGASAAEPGAAATAP